MTREIDCRKLDCPAPLLQTEKLLKAQPISSIRILVDNDAALESVSLFLRSKGFEVGVDSDGITSAVEGTLDPAQATPINFPSQTEEKKTQAQKIMVLVSGDKIGRGDDELGAKLMVNFIKTLEEMGKDLWQLVFVNHGVKLTTKDSGVLSELEALENHGIMILVCGTCLSHLGLTKEKKIGQTTNMLDIVTAMQIADKVVNL